MGAFRAIIDKEIRSIAKERTIMLAIIIQLVIASFSSVILFGLMSYYDPSTIGQNSALDISVGIVGDGNSPLIGYLENAHISTVPYVSAESAQSDYDRGKIKAIIYLPQTAAGVTEMKLFMPPPTDPKSTVIMTVLQGPLKQYENFLRGLNGIEVHYQDVKGRMSTTWEFQYSFIIPLLMLFPAFIAGSIMIDTLSEEFENKTIDTLLSTPVTLKTMIGAKLVAVEFIAVIQCVLWTVLLSFNRIYIQNVWAVLLLAAIISAFVALGSALLSLYFKDRERSQFLFSILLLTIASLSYLLNPSPIGLMARLASGDLNVGPMDVIVYLVPLAVLLVLLFAGARRLAAVKT